MLLDIFLALILSVIFNFLKSVFDLIKENSFLPCDCIDCM